MCAYGIPDLMCKASADGNIEYVKKCIDRGENIETKDLYYKRTMLSLASMHGQQDIVRLLLDYGADAETRDWCEKTPIMHASENGYLEIVELLANRGADIEARDKYGQTPIMHSARYGHEKVTRFLAERGANIVARNAGGETPFSVAMEKGPVSVALFLASGTIMEPSVSYSDIAISGLTPFLPKTRERFWVSGMFEEIIPNIVPIYMNRAVTDPDFGFAMQRDIENLLGKNIKNDGQNWIDEHRVFLKHTLKTLRSIDYTDHTDGTGPNGDGGCHSTYDMEL